MVEEEEPNKYYFRWVLRWCSCTNRICCSNNTEYRNWTCNGEAWFSYGFQPILLLPYTPKKTIPEQVFQCYPVIVTNNKSVRIIAGTTLMMVIFRSLILFKQFGLIYLVTAGVFGAVMIALSVWLLIRPSEKASWTVFKFSSPYLTALFIVL